MEFEVSSIKVQELARIAGVTQPAISRKFKDEGGIKNERNRIIGITPEAIEQYLTDRDQGQIYRGGVYLTSNLCGGTSKTTSCLALGAAFRRIADPKKSPVIWLDYDQQGSLTSVLAGSPTPDDKPVLVDYFDGKATLDELLLPVGNPADNLWLIGSNLKNLYLEKILSTPQAMRPSMARLMKDIFAKFGDRAKIFCDSPPALSSSTASMICALSELQGKYDTKLLIPLRSDRFSFTGAKMQMNEKKSILEAFNLPPIQTIVFLSSFDKRLKISMEILSQLFNDPTLKDFVAPVYCRFSSEISKAHQGNRSIFSGSVNSSATEDYTDLMLVVMGYKKFLLEGNA